MLSVVIPTRNRAGLLAQALASMVRQTLPPQEFEVLVVDNGSTDGTAAVAADFASAIPNLRYLREPTPGLHAGRHKGVQAARGETLTFADDDIEPLPSWLASVVEAFADPAVAMVGGNNLPLFVETPPPWLLALWRRPAPDGGRALPPLSLLELPGGPRPFSPLRVWGCNFSVRRAVLLAAGGFHPDAMPEHLLRLRGDGETHVSRYVAASGLKCLFHPGASVYHKVMPERMTFAYFRQRGYGQGISDSFTDLRDPSQRNNQAAERGILRRAAGWARRRLFEQLEPGAGRALRELAAGHREGYAFHQRAYHEDAELRAWVHRPDYFEELPPDA
jgi:glycosyltransferase involved in cell wall biosynthesis